MALLEDMGYPEGISESLRGVWLCVSLENNPVIFQNADSSLKNGLVSVPENSAQGYGFLMERRIRLPNTCHLTEEHNDAFSS